jgi:hypothetical protein
MDSLGLLAGAKKQLIPELIISRNICLNARIRPM